MPLPHVRVPPRKWHWADGVANDPSVEPRHVQAQCGRRVDRTTVLGRARFGERPAGLRCRRCHRLHTDNELRVRRWGRYGRGRAQA